MLTYTFYNSGRKIHSGNAESALRSFQSRIVEKSQISVLI